MSRPSCPVLGADCMHKDAKGNCTKRLRDQRRFRPCPYFLRRPRDQAEREAIIKGQGEALRQRYGNDHNQLTLVSCLEGKDE